jgi:PKD repeat protein
VPITLSGSGTDADGDALTYTWNFGDGSIGAGASPSHAYASLGTFTVTLTVSDGFGGSASATTTATISNRAPTANPGGPYTGVRGVPITLSGSGTDADGDPLTYRWTFGDGATGSGASAAHAYASLGTFTVTLIANDGRVDSASATTTVTIINLPPVANAGSDGRAGRNSLVILSGSGSDSDGSIVTYRWRQVSGPGVVLSGSNTSQARFMTPSVFVTTPLTFELTVTDNDGATASDEVVITVCGNPKACFDE